MAEIENLPAVVKLRPAPGSKIGLSASVTSADFFLTGSLQLAWNRISPIGRKNFVVEHQGV